MLGHGRRHAAAYPLDVIGMDTLDEIVAVDAPRFRWKTQEIGERSGEEDVIRAGVSIGNANAGDFHGEFGLLEPFT